MKHPTPITWEWWRVTLANLVKACVAPREPSHDETYARVEDHDERMRAALRGEVRRPRQAA
ncbi:hypothetical protein [Roseiarcus sp.]|uniref:hypothetical protein n=1 Tax=Roseiarcus sp. TaxID=1969460 RepID=UPI003F9DB310